MLLPTYSVLAVTGPCALNDDRRITAYLDAALALMEALMG